MRRRYFGRDGLKLGAAACRIYAAGLNLQSETIRVVDRAGGAFGVGGHAPLKPVGRPGDIYGDVLVSVPAIRFGRAA